MRIGYSSGFIHLYNNKMEGNLHMWTGVLSQWKTFYFIVHNDVVTFCTEKGGEKEGSIHLKVASIASVIDDPLKINIHTGTHILFLRADTVNQRIEWMKAFSAAQQEVFSNDVSLQMMRIESDGVREYEVIQKRMRSLESLVAQLWNSQAQLEDVLTQLMTKLQRSTSSRLCEKIVQITNNIKYKASDAIKLVEQIKVRQREKPPSYRQKDSLESNQPILTSNGNARVPNQNTPLLRINSLSNGSIDQYQSFEKGYHPQFNNQPSKNISIDQYQSFDTIVHQGKSLQKVNEMSNDSEYKSFDRAEPPVSLRLLKKISEDSDSSFKDFKEFGGPSVAPPTHLLKKVSGNPYNMDEKCSHNYKNNLVQRNLVFIQYPMTSETYRASLPVSVAPQLKINIMSILKDSIGSDLTKISLPVTLNEPLSLLQKGCEQMYYSSLLDQANMESDPLDRLLYVVAFAVSQYSLTINKTKKPFNPLLGETFEYVDNKRKFRYLAEQVSHHPPVSAMNCFSQNFSYYTNSKSQTNFRGASIKVTPQSCCRVVLNRSKDVIVFNRCVTSLNNLIVGSLYVDNYGDVKFQMYNAGHIIASADVKFSESSIWGNSQYKVEGALRDTKGREYQVEGRWNQSFSYTDSRAGITKQIWGVTHHSIPENYYFNELATDLNNLNYETLDLIAPTDCRLRPDQRALEYGNKELAASEKNRLQKQQRERRKVMEERREHHNPWWFQEMRVHESGEMEWVSNDKYWEERKQQTWNGCPEIF